MTGDEQKLVLPADMTGETLFFSEPPSRCESCGASLEWVHADDYDRVKAEIERLARLILQAADDDVDPAAALAYLARVAASMRTKRAPEGPP